MSDYDEAGQLGGYPAMQNAVAMETKYDPRMTVRARIAVQKKHLSAQLEHLDKIEKLLNENPAIEQFQDLMAKVHL